MLRLQALAKNSFLENSRFIAHKNLLGKTALSVNIPSNLQLHRGFDMYSDEPEEPERKREHLGEFARKLKYEKRKQALLSGPPRELLIPESASARTLSNVIGFKTVDILKTLIKIGECPETSSAVLRKDLVDVIVSEYNVIPVRRNIEDRMELGRRMYTAEELDAFPQRPPVVAIMGHINHGKTSLLDALRDSRITEKEAGGITQQIAAFSVDTPSGSKITFIDTPGHEAFYGMRSRGSNIVDIVILIIAADEGVKEQTIEAIQHIKKARLPVIVAINKCDKYGADPAKVKQQLLEHDIITQDFGGEVQTVQISAAKRQGLNELEDVIMLQAEINDIRANPNGNAEGVVIEARLEKGRGPLATLLVQSGDLKVGDYFVSGTTFGRVRSLVSDRGAYIKSASCSAAVEVVGFRDLPEQGADFIVVESEKRARAVAEYRADKKLVEKSSEHSKVLAEKVAKRTAERMGLSEKSPSEENEEGEEMDAEQQPKEPKPFNLVIRADGGGSLEAIVNGFKEIPQDEVLLRVVHSGVGTVNESDIMHANTAGAQVAAFNVDIKPKALKLARDLGVNIIKTRLIYGLFDSVKEQMSELLDPLIEYDVTGQAEVREVFDLSKKKAGEAKVAGCRVTLGLIKRSTPIRVVRGGKIIHEGKIGQLRHHKDIVNEIRTGMECGLNVEGWDEVQVGDIIQCFTTRTIKRKIE